MALCMEKALLWIFSRRTSHLFRTCYSITRLSTSKVRGIAKALEHANRHGIEPGPQTCFLLLCHNDIASRAAISDHRRVPQTLQLRLIDGDLICFDTIRGSCYTNRRMTHSSSSNAFDWRLDLQEAVCDPSPQQTSFSWPSPLLCSIMSTTPLYRVCGLRILR